jgi:CRP/FNR family transcriptional regulator, cyclic AMP receptor protein
MGLVDLIGFSAGLLVILACSMRDLLRLRCCSIASNLLFLTFGIAGDVLPVAILHAVLLPLNALRLWEMVRRRNPDASAHEPAS